MNECFRSDSTNLQIILFQTSSHDEASNAAKAIDSDFDDHLEFAVISKANMQMNSNILNSDSMECLKGRFKLTAELNESCQL